MKDLIIVGAGGFGREVAWFVERINKRSPTWNLLGFIDDDERIRGAVINSYKVLGNTTEVIDYPGAYFVCAVGSSKTREKIVDKVKDVNPNIKFGVVIDPSAEKSDLVTIDEGTIVCPHAIITVNVVIGAHVIVNYDSTVGHDATINDFATLYPAVNISGMTNIGRCVELGTGTQIIQGKTVGDYTIVGAGSVVVKNLPSKCMAVGCPSNPIKFFDS